jgi:hypothetical protein
VVKKITLSLKKRAAPYGGAQESKRFNDFINEVSHDLIGVQRQWNSIAYPLFASLPQGEQDTRWELGSDINPVIHGFDGTQIFMDMDATETTDDGRYFTTTDQRPKTLKEVAEDAQTQINEINEAVQLIEVLGGEGLTEEQKAKIGLNIFNPFQSSASDSLDGRSRRNEFNVTQLAKDLYGPTFTLDGDGEPNLANSVKDMVDALLELHGGDWDSDITLEHEIDNDDIIAAAGILQTKINKSESYTTLNRSATIINLQNDLNRIRYEIGAVRGNNSWNTDFSNIPYVGAPVSLQGHVALVGSGTASASNPHGLTAADIGLSGSLSAIVTFTGMDNETDSTPDYSSSNFINANDPLETAIGKLDTQLKLTDDENDAHRAITDGNPHGVDMDDFAANDVVSRINLASNYISADRITDGSLNAIPTLVQETAWDNHLTTSTNAHDAVAIDVDDSFFNAIEGTNVQDALESIDTELDERRLELEFSSHVDAAEPIIFAHGRGIYPIVQLVDTSITDADYYYENTTTDGLDLFVNIEHVDKNTFRVWTNSTEGVIIALF